MTLMFSPIPSSVLLVCLVIAHPVFAQETSSTSTSPPSNTPPALKVVKLLWTAQPAGAAAALEKAIDQAVARNQLEFLREHLAALAEKTRAVLDKDPTDPRWLVSVASQSLLKDPRAESLLQSAITGAKPSQLKNTQREFLLKCWLASQPDSAHEYLRQTVSQAKAPTPEASAWLETCVVRWLESDRQAATEIILKHWSQLPGPVQLVAVEPLTQTAHSMKRFVQAIEAGSIPKDLLNTNQLLKWSNSEDAELKSAIERVWGRVRMAEDSDRKQVVQRTLQLLASGKSGNPLQGQAHFKRICSQCHRLHGEGVELGPDITGNGRGSFEQLVSNVMDPSLVIGKAFTAKTVLASDGRVVSGLVVAEDEKRLTLKVQGGKQIEFDLEEEVESIKDSVKSLMPDGLEQQMTEQELLDLFAYLCLARPIGAEENATIPGTPAKLLPSEQ